MSPDHRPGSLAEDWIARRLSEQGWRIRARNLRTPFGELDLLAEDPEGPALVAVEVKARSTAWITEEERLRPTQQGRLMRALDWCAGRMGWRGALRLDLAAVALEQGRPAGWRHLPGVDAEWVAPDRS